MATNYCEWATVVITPQAAYTNPALVSMAESLEISVSRTESLLRRERGVSRSNGHTFGGASPGAGPLLQEVMDTPLWGVTRCWPC